MPVDMVLDDNERSFCLIVAAMRNNPKEEAHVISKKILAHRSEYETHAIGMCAEFAVAKYFHLLPSLHVSLYGDGNIADLDIYGWTCQIKCRDKVGYDFALLTDSPEDFRADCGILVYRITEYIYRIHGVISRKKFLRVARIQNYGYGPRLVADPCEFSHPSMLAKTSKTIDTPISICM